MKLVTRALIASSAMALMLATSPASFAQSGNGTGNSSIENAISVVALQQALDNGEIEKAATIIASLSTAQLTSIQNNPAVKNSLSRALNTGTRSTLLANAIKTKTIANPEKAAVFVNFASAVGNTSLTKKVGTALAQAANSFENQKTGATTEKAVKELAAKVEAIANAVETNSNMKTAYNNNYKPVSVETEGTASINTDQGTEQQQEQATDDEPTGTVNQQVANNAATGSTNQNIGVSTTPATPAPSASPN